ncbi:MAG: DUF3326 domain-containing protein [Bacteroidota bacterium]
MKPFTVLSLIPTGIGASFGGYAGDGAPATNLLACAADRLITHPNALNAATFFARRPNILYVEGYALDRFVEGAWALREVRANRIGLILDRAAEHTLPSLLNVCNALRASAGLSIEGVALTDAPVGARVVTGTNGISSGEVENPGTLLDAAEKLVRAGAEAVAIACSLEGGDDENYIQGRGPDPIGGLEAILSHLVVSQLGVPAAHAPAELPWTPDGVVPPLVAAEACGSYLPSILIGLSQAPPLVPVADRKRGDLTAEDIDLLVAPHSCFGGAPMFACKRSGIPMLAVRENETVLSVPPEALGMEAIAVSSYLEAAGVILAMKEGISLASLRRPLLGVSP